ncbi:MAG: tRNA (adenosine(37)-N6)-threonylcarbamoyltransferase complex ATPase subunit type 1 TsaE [Candidatus Margulisbacteria bacterium]|nr:tRNA (adenosine(37)-N6)-threonylcarbamoyltransferase complex ATPase subunit type 1 TsaE [Candidatus Margulisiibacteriota bacterium]
MVIETKNRGQTHKLGKKIGGALKDGEIVAFYGPLGAGKTTLIQGIAEGFGVKDYVTSPTFTLINEYQGKAFPLYHIDLYRLEDINEIDDLGIDEYFLKDGVCLIEWAEKMEESLPKDVIKIKIKYISEDERHIWLSSELQARLK